MSYVTGETLPYIRPDGYNAALGQEPVEFRCFVPSDTIVVSWLINGMSTNTIPKETLEERGIELNPIRITGDETYYFNISVEASMENDHISLKCVAAFLNTEPSLSEAILLSVQGNYLWDTYMYTYLDSFSPTCSLF